MGLYRPCGQAMSTTLYRYTGGKGERISNHGYTHMGLQAENKLKKDSWTMKPTTGFRPWLTRPSTSLPTRLCSDSTTNVVLATSTWLNDGRWELGCPSTDFTDVMGAYWRLLNHALWQESSGQDPLTPNRQASDAAEMLFAGQGRRGSIVTMVYRRRTLRHLGGTPGATGWAAGLP